MALATIPAPNRRFPGPALAEVAGADLATPGAGEAIGTSSWIGTAFFNAARSDYFQALARAAAGIELQPWSMPPGS